MDYYGQKSQMPDGVWTNSESVKQFMGYMGVSFHDLT
jgi:hypothetical protein